MAAPTILTGQFVRISQSPASIGERLLARMVDLLFIGIYIFSTAKLLSVIPSPSGGRYLLFMAAIYLPVWSYSFLFETFNHGQSPGKRLLGIRVVKADGSMPSPGSYLLRWILFPIDGPLTGGLGLLVILLTNHHQRLGDLAAGTMVIKEKEYRKIHVSLDEFDYLMAHYHPVYPQAAELSLEQVALISRTLDSGRKNRAHRIALLAEKVEQALALHPQDGDREKFLQTLIRDYQYYALEE